MEKYFGIDYTFEKNLVRERIDQIVTSSQKGYVCVADGVTLSMSQNNNDLRSVLNHSAINICDSGWVPMYLRWIYGIKRDQYCGSDILIDLVNAKKYKMMFMGASDNTLEALQKSLSAKDERIRDMKFCSLPFREVDGFDYEAIANQIKEENPDIVFVSLGMPKQEFFMYRLEPFLERGVLIGVGAAFKFHSGLPDQKRAPQWMIKSKMEWVHRIFSEPKKQLKRCSLIFITMPTLLIKEYRIKIKTK